MNGEMIFRILQDITINFVNDYIIFRKDDTSVDFRVNVTLVVIPARETQITVPSLPLYVSVVEGTEILLI